MRKKTLSLLKRVLKKTRTQNSIFWAAAAWFFTSIDLFMVGKSCSYFCRQRRISSFVVVHGKKRSQWSSSWTGATGPTSKWFTSVLLRVQPCDYRTLHHAVICHGAIRQTPQNARPSLKTHLLTPISKAACLPARKNALQFFIKKVGYFLSCSRIAVHKCITCQTEHVLIAKWVENCKKNSFFFKKRA